MISAMKMPAESGHFGAIESGQLSHRIERDARPVFSAPSHISLTVKKRPCRASCKSFAPMLTWGWVQTHPLSNVC